VTAAAPASGAPAADSDEVIRRVEGSVGRLTLNRPKAINALSHAMVLAMT